MVELTDAAAAAPPTPASTLDRQERSVDALSAESVRAVVERTCGRAPGTDGADLVETIADFEVLTNALAAGQARMGAALRELREADVLAREEAAGAAAQEGPHAGPWSTARRDRELAVARRSAVSEVALARQESPHRAERLLGLATVLPEMPETLRLFQEGRVSEWRASLMARETACLSREDRRAVDAAMADGLPGMGTRRLVAVAREHACRRDARAVVKRAAYARSQRCVSLRPAPDTMAWLSALVPVEQGVAAFAALTRVARSAQAAGDARGRGRGQIMADTVVERLTGVSRADGVPVEVQLVMTDQALLAGGDTPAQVAGHGPIPAGVARAILAGGLEVEHHPRGVNPLDVESQVFLRRLYTRPGTGELVAMESGRRLFPDGLKHFIAARDGHVCRTPYCGAPPPRGRPRDAVRAGRPHHGEQCPGALPGVQLDQGGTRMARPRLPHRRHHARHPHRTRVRVPAAGPPPRAPGSPRPSPPRAPDTPPRDDARPCPRPDPPHGGPGRPLG